MKPPPSAIVAAKQQAFDDLRSHLPKRPDPPAHHVRIEELHDAMALMPNLKNRVSLSNLIDLMHALNAKLDERQAPPHADGGVRVTEEMVEAALNVPLDGVESPGCWRVRSILTTAQVRAALLAAGKGKV